jgi:hypothetical protein
LEKSVGCVGGRIVGRLLCFITYPLYQLSFYRSLFNASDSWLWKTTNSESFSVREAYLSLTSRVDEIATEEGHADFIGIKSVPLKVSVFAWHFLADRLPTKDNLIRREIMSVGCQFCSLACGCVVSLSYLFFVCEGFLRMWCGVRNRLGIQGALLNSAFSHALISVVFKCVFRI